jgi:tetratricopeptide (TPR) repeat protein
MSALAQVFQTAEADQPKNFFTFSFNFHLGQAKTDVLQLRLLRLCRLQLEGELTDHAAAPIDFQPELTTLIDQLIAGEGLETTILTNRDRRVLPAVKSFLETLPRDKADQGLIEPDGTPINSPTPAWLDLGIEVLNEVYQATKTVVASSDILEQLADFPLAEAFVHLEVGEHHRREGELSGAMLNLSSAHEILKDSYRHSGDAEDIWIGRLYGICLERIGRLHQQYGRLEEAIQVMQTGRSVYKEIGARDGVRTTLKDEAGIWIELGQPERAEQMLKQVVSESEGSGRANELRDLLDLANVYRHLRPWFEGELKIGPEQSPQAQPAAVDDAQNPDESASVEPRADDVEELFERKGGIAVVINVEGHDELASRDLIGNESLRLMYRALAVAILNGDKDLERIVMGRIVSAYAEKGFRSNANAIFDRMLESSSLEEAGLDAQFFAFNRLRDLAESQEEAGDDQQLINSTRTEQLELLEFILAQGEDQMSSLLRANLGGDRACLLEALDCADEARLQYRQTIEELERSRFFMRNPENKRVAVSALATIC